jgi:hypothetical protein
VIVVQVNSLDLNPLSVQEKSISGSEFDGAESKAGVIFIPLLISCFQYGSDLV